MADLSYPRKPEGDVKKDLERLWEDLFKLVEQLNVKEEQKQ